MKRFVIAALGFAASAAFAASPYDQVYSIITTDTKPSADWHVKPVFVNRVDGENSVMKNQHVVPPGPHEVTVDLPPRGGFHQPTQHTFKLVTEPCVRYFVAARIETDITQPWVPMVRYTEPIGECQAKFKIAGAR